MTTPSPLLSRVNALVGKQPSSVGTAVRHSLNILAGNDDPDTKTVRIYGKLTDLEPADRDAAIAAIEQLSD